MPAPFNPNHTLDDADVIATDATRMNAGAVQSFLTKHDSPLATLKVGDEHLSSILVRLCEAAVPAVSPRVILIRLQAEQSLISGNPHPTQHALDWALGFGASDSGRNPVYRGIVPQLVHGIAWWANHWDGAAEHVGKPFKTSDGYIIHPVNRATYLTLLFCPWQGDKDSHGNTAPFGAKLAAICKDRFFP